MLSALVRERRELNDFFVDWEVAGPRPNRDELSRAFDRLTELRHELEGYEDHEIYEETRRQLLEVFEEHAIGRCNISPAEDIRFWHEWRVQADRFELVPPDVLAARELAYAALTVLEDIEGQYLNVQDDNIVSQRYVTAAGKYERARVDVWVTASLQGYEQAIVPDPTAVELRVMIIRCTLYLLREGRTEFTELWDDDDSPLHAHASEIGLFNALTAETAALLLSTWANEKGGNPSVVSKWEAVARAVAEISGQPKPEAATVEQAWRRWCRRNPGER